MAAGDLHLSIHLGQRWTAAVVTLAGRTWPVTFDGQTRLPSGAYLASPDGPPLTGLAGQTSAMADPDHYLPHPLNALRVTATDSEALPIAATSALLAHVANAASLHAGAAVSTLALTTPEPWGPNSRQRLRQTTLAAGLPEPAIVTAPAAAVAATRRPDEGPGGFVLVCTVPDDYPTVCILDTAGSYPQLAAATVKDSTALSITESLTEVIRQRSSGEPTPPAKPDWMAAAEIARAREALATQPRTPVLLPDASTPVVMDQADLAQAAQPHLDQIGPTVTQAAADADINVTDISATVLVSDEATAPLARDALIKAGLPAPTVLTQPEHLAAGAAQLSAPASTAPATAATTQLPRTRLTLSNLTTTAVLAVGSTALLIQTVKTADVNTIGGSIVWIMLAIENLGLAAALAATAATAAAQIAPTTWLSPQGMAEPTSTGFLLRRSYLAAAATGLALAGLWGLGTGVALQFVDPRYLRWSLSAAVPIVLCALVIAVVSPRIPANRLATWLPSLRPPLWPIATAMIGTFAIRMAYTTAVLTEDVPKVHLAAAIGAALLGAGTAATISRNLWIRVATGVFLVPGYALIVDPRTDVYLVTAYTATLVWWHLNATARTIRTAIPDDFHPLRKPD